MIKPLHTPLLCGLTIIALTSAIVVAGCERRPSSPLANPDRIIYDSDGGGVVTLTPADRVYMVYGSHSDLRLRSDIGGTLDDCSTDQLHCVEFGDLPISVPKTGDAREWTTGKWEFRVVHQDVDGSRLIEAFERGKLVARFLFAPDRGLVWYSLVYRDGSGRMSQRDRARGAGLWAEQGGRTQPEG
jgi:hypothetical protein